MLILPTSSTKLYLTVFTGIKLIIDVPLIKYSFLARLLLVPSISNKGMAVSRGKLGTLIGIETHKDTGQISKTEIR